MSDGDEGTTSQPSTLNQRQHRDQPELQQQRLPQRQPQHNLQHKQLQPPPLLSARSYTPAHTPHTTTLHNMNPPPETNALPRLLATSVSAALAAALSMGALFTAWVRKMAPPRLYYTNTDANIRLLLAMPLLWRTYVPNVFCWNAHLASLFGYMRLRPIASKPALTERILLSDGGTVSLEWGRSAADGEPVILLLPGINNHAAMPYIRHVMDVIMAEGLGAPAALNWRGLGGLSLTAVSGTPKPYCALAVEDVEQVISHLSRRLPSCPIYAVGYSMGGGLLVRHLGESGAACRLRAAMAVSPALDLAAVYAHMGSSLQGRAYALLISLGLWGYFMKHRHALRGGPVGALDALRAAVFGGYEGRVFMPLWGLEGGCAEYHERASGACVVSSVRRPLLVLHSEDDPIVPLHTVPVECMSRNPLVVCAVTRHGGHIGYTAGISPLAHTWADRMLVHYLKHMEREGARGDNGAAAAPVFVQQHRTPKSRL